MIKYPIKFPELNEVAESFGLKVCYELSESYGPDYCQWPPHRIVSIKTSTFTFQINNDISKHK